MKASDVKKKLPKLSAKIKYNDSGRLKNARKVKNGRKIKR